MTNGTAINEATLRDSGLRSSAAIRAAEAVGPEADLPRRGHAAVQAVPPDVGTHLGDDHVVDRLVVEDPTADDLARPLVVDLDDAGDRRQVGGVEVPRPAGG